MFVPPLATTSVDDGDDDSDGQVDDGLHNDDGDNDGVNNDLSGGDFNGLRVRFDFAVLFTNSNSMCHIRRSRMSAAA